VYLDVSISISKDIGYSSLGGRKVVYINFKHIL